MRILILVFLFIQTLSFSQRAKIDTLWTSEEFGFVNYCSRVTLKIAGEKIQTTVQVRFRDDTLTEVQLTMSGRDVFYWDRFKEENKLSKSPNYFYLRCPDSALSIRKEDISYVPVLYLPNFSNYENYFHYIYKRKKIKLEWN
jgi:hypothetical protein